MGKADGNYPPKFGYEDWKKEQYIEPSKSVIFKKETFKCKYCGKIGDKEHSIKIHETWCKDNPNARNRKYKQIGGKKVAEHKHKAKQYSIEEIKEIDKVVKLTDAQIARLVRGEKN